MHWHNAYVTALAWGVFSSAPSSSSSVVAFVLPRQRQHRPPAPHQLQQQQKQQQQKQQPNGRVASLKMVGQMGWDNENFLESLGKGADAIQAANEEYRSQSRYRPSSPDDQEDVTDAGRAIIEPEVDDNRPIALSNNPEEELPTADAEGAVLTEEMKEQMKRAHENPLEEGSQGGKLFRELLARAQGGGGGGGGGGAAVPPPPPPPPAAYHPPPQPAATAAYPGAAVPPLSQQPPLTIEQQAELYRQMVLQQAQASARTGSFVPPPPPPVVGGAAMMTPTQAAAAANRRVGRNRDADAIVNTSDVYFAQLKLDSSVRNIARYTGDEEAANKPFADPAIQEIKMHVNPYLSEAREKEQLLYETAAEERLELALANAATRQHNVPKDFAGIKYKEKLQQRRKQQQQQQTVKNPATSETTTAPPVDPLTTATSLAAPAVEAPKPAAPEPAPVDTEPRTLAPAPAVTVSAAPKPMTPPPPQRVQQVAPPPAAVTTPTAPVKDDETSTKSDIRTLMGLLLKHRGGPGFGSGRLQGPDVDRFEQIAEQVLSVIQGETPLERTAPLKTFEATEPAPAAGRAAAPPTAATSSAISMKPAATTTSIENMIAYIEGAIVMYKNSPPMLQDSVLGTLRAAFVSAVGTLNDLLSGTVSTADLSAQVASGANTPTAERVQSIFLCIEGAIQMYKNSPPMLQESVLGSLRAALLTGVGTLNAIMATDSGMTASVAPSYLDVIPERSTSPPPASPSAVATAPVTTPSSPSVAAEPQQDTPMYSGRDVNSQFFEQVYSKLEAAAGDGKMGLKKDLSAEEAAELADSIAQMRSMLVDELQNGIPGENDGASTKQTQSAGSTASGSKYQDLLAKARANKENYK